MLEKTQLEQLRETEPARILVVDDDEDMLVLLKLYLQQAGYRVETAESALEGLELLDEFTPDVMCVDFMMPGMDGQALARQIRSRRDMLYVPIVMLTAAGASSLNSESKVSENTKIASLDSGVDAFLNKPVNYEELRVTIRAMLRLKAAQDKMLDALERVAHVQDELLAYERAEGQHEAMLSTINTYTVELYQPLSEAHTATDQLQTLLEGLPSCTTQELPQLAAQAQIWLNELWAALTKASQTLDRLKTTGQTITNKA